MGNDAIASLDFSVPEHEVITKVCKLQLGKVWLLH